MTHDDSTMMACVWTGGSTLSVERVPRPHLQPGWALVDVDFVGLCGTDLHISQGHHPRALPGVVLGHEVTGILPAATSNLAAGTPVFFSPFVTCGACDACRAGRRQLCDTLRLIGADFGGGLADQVAVPIENLYPLPTDLPRRRAVLVEPVAVVVHALRRAEFAPAQSIVIVGGGPIGLLAALVASSNAAAVTVLETSEARRAQARRLGIDVEQPGAPLPLADVVIDASGHPNATVGLCALTKTGGRVVLLATQPSDVALDLKRVMAKELSVVGSGGYTPDDIRVSIELLTSARGQALERVITRIVSLADAPLAIDELRSGSQLKAVVAVSGEVEAPSD